MKTIAITRQISPSINECELTHLEREVIDFDRACHQHQQYEEALRSLGVQVVSLPAEPYLPDSVFVEDAALVLDECAILTRPGALSRREETSSIQAALAPHRKIHQIQPPGTLDGGDILSVGRNIFVGVTTRSSNDAILQLQKILEPLGYQVKSIPVNGCLHLKSAVTMVGEDTLLINPEWVSGEDFPGMNLINIDPTEPGAANALFVDGTIIYPTSFPKTKELLEKAGINLLTVPADELAKAEGAVTCCSLIIKQ